MANPLASWMLGALCAGGLTAGAVSVAATSSSTATAVLPTAVSETSQVAHLREVKHQLAQQLAAVAAPTTAAPRGDASSVTPATWTPKPTEPPTTGVPVAAPTTTVPAASPTPTTAAPPVRWVDDEGSGGSDDGGSAQHSGENDD